MKYKIDNAVILAAGTASRFAPLSYEHPKSLITVKGEVLIERQIKQLREAGIDEIIIVTGYQKEKFEYLIDKYNLILLENDSYLTRNNNASIYCAQKYLHNTYICSSDNYFTKNPFEKEADGSYYCSLFSEGETNEWCFGIDNEDNIKKITIGGRNTWYMLGYAFWDENFSKKFIKILNQVYNNPETYNLYWEDILIQHLSELNIKIKRCPSDLIFEFDTIDELREFDSEYINNTHSSILKKAARELNCEEKDIVNILSYRSKDNAASGFTFDVLDKSYRYDYEKEIIELI